VNHETVGPPAAPDEPNPTRRALIKSGGLVIGFTWLAAPRRALAFASGKAQPGDAAAARADGNPPFAPNAFVRIGPDGAVRLVMPFVEMGQGTFTMQATLLAEELGVDVNQVRLIHAPPNEALYGFELAGGQVTGGSMSTRSTWNVLREAGAVARTMLVGAASARWRVPAQQCIVERGVVHHAPTQRSLSFGQLAVDAARQPVPDKPELLSAQAHRLIGKMQQRPDTPAKTDGSLTFAIDVRVPGMRVAAIASAPRLGARARRVDDRRTRAIAGVVDVVPLGDAVAVTAADFWTARKGAEALAIDWEAGPHPVPSMDAIEADMAQLSTTGKALVAKEAGNGAATTTRRVEATYQAAMLAHATMEPMSAVVAVRPDACEIWAGTQLPARVVERAAGITGLPPDKITVHNQFFGGGFGRRLETDFIEQAVELARHVAYPVKLVWTREQDISRDAFRPPYHDRLTATLDRQGLPVTWAHRVTSDSVLERWSPADMPKDGLDPDCVDGAIEPPYALPSLRVEFVRHRLSPAIRIGWWRGVGPTHNLFPIESFIDELAHEARQDPVAYRRALLAHNPRARAVLDAAATKFGWGSPQGKRVGQGVALGMPMSTYICAMVEVEVSPQGVIQLRRAVAAVDCGTAVNPDIVAAQVQGGLIFGFGAALYGEVTLHDGVVQQQNYNDVRVLRMNEAPRIEVVIVPSTEPPTGIGEPPTAIAAPCLANALFAATGVRVRHMPLARAMLAASPAALDQVVT
jgi:isoquinoline 1-oxidoreductase subunit beta